jgi:hypothetical protein
MTRAVRFKQADLLWNKEYFWNYYGARREVYSTRVIRALPGVSQVMSSNFDLVAEEKIESETVTKKMENAPALKGRVETRGIRG